MPKFCIGCGKISYLYKYILGCLLFNILKKISLNFCTTLNDQKLMQSIYNNVGFILFGIIFFFKYKQFIKKDKNEEKRINKGTDYSLIYNDISENQLIDTPQMIIVCVIYAFYYEAKKLIKYFGYYDIELWTFEIIFILLITNIYFPKIIYKHQKYSMLFIIVVDSILIIYASTLKVYFINNEFKNIYQIKGYTHCLIFCIIFIDITFLFSYAKIRGKILMDIYFISPFSFSIFIGFLGLFINSIQFIVFLAKGNDGDYNNDEKNIYNYSNILNYFIDISNRKGTTLFIEIIIPIFYMFVSFMALLYELLIMKYLNPNFTLMSDNIFYEIIKVKDFVFTKNPSFAGTVKFTVLQFAEIFEFIGCTIYLEIIVLNFCNLNKNIKSNIIKRGEKDIHELSILDDSSFFNDSNDSRFSRFGSCP